MAIKELSNSLIVPNLQALRLEVVTHKIHTQEPCNQVTKNKQASEQASNQANKENHHSILGKFIFFLCWVLFIAVPSVAMGSTHSTELRP